MRFWLARRDGYRLPAGCHPLRSGGGFRGGGFRHGRVGLHAHGECPTVRLIGPDPDGRLGLSLDGPGLNVTRRMWNCFSSVGTALRCVCRGTTPFDDPERLVPLDDNFVEAVCRRRARGTRARPDGRSARRRRCLRRPTGPRACEDRRRWSAGRSARRDSRPGRPVSSRPRGRRSRGPGCVPPRPTWLGGRRWGISRR